MDDTRSDTREEILLAADRIFGDVGYDAASTREIAECSGVNKALIHYHFKSKEGLLASVLDRYYEKLQAEIEVALAGEGTLRARLDCLVDVYADFLGRNRSFCRIVQREACGGRHAAKIRQRMIPLFRLGKQMVVEYYPSTASGDLAAEQLMLSLYGVIITYFTYSDVIEPLLGSDPMSEASLAARKRHVRRLLDVLLAAIAAEEAGDVR